MQRIAIIGCCGAGKSTLANHLGARLGLPVIHLDYHYWQPGWIETPTEKWIEKQQYLVNSDRWIIDGNYLSTMDIRLQAADTIILLDFSRFLCLWRIFRRYLQYYSPDKELVRPDMADGCAERLSWDFLLYVWNFAHHQRQHVLSKLELYQHDRKVTILKNPQQVDSFLSELNPLA
ncbi:Topology modulation protein [Hyella patelloides LEGE 07179]|uniref:Topology modulation protein n=1 Tax=Hyella patelloides LEGE 07179 TaxID=945734 RepID=A0A563VVX4_9CYAN|nr:DNA topology modulation protein [Hyella patelloides]VEP15592.1 Topology modulation protein [Hyella patelloides LEGE 07179]